MNVIKTRTSYPKLSIAPNFLNLIRGGIRFLLFLLFLMMGHGLKAVTTTLTFFGSPNQTSECNTSGSTSLAFDHKINITELCGSSPPVLNILHVGGVHIIYRKNNVIVDQLYAANVTATYSNGNVSVADVLHIYGTRQITNTGTPGSWADWTVEVRYTYNCGTGNVQRSYSSTSSLRTNYPAVPPIIASATNVRCNAFRANWNSTNGATSYRVDVATDASFQNLVNGYNNVLVNSASATFLDITGLNMNTTYYYRVRANQSSCGFTAYSQTATVTTQGLLSPPGAATFVQDGCSLTVSWPVVPGATGYLLQADNGVFYIFDQEVSSNSQVFTNLAVNGTYNFKVATVNGTGCWGNYGSASSYTIQPIAAPTGVSHNNITCSSAVVTWTSAYTLLHVQVSTSNTFSPLIQDYDVSVGIGSSGTTIANLEPGKTYYYRIAAKAGANCMGSYSATGSFTTNSLPAPNVGAYSPSNIKCESFTANWGAVAGATHYLIEVSPNMAFSQILSGYPKQVTATNENISGLSPNTIYYYRVKAVGSSCASIYSSVRGAQTATLPAAPNVFVLPAGITCNSANIQWQPTTGATQYRVVVYNYPSGTVVIDTILPTPAYLFNASSLLPVTQYTYAVTVTVGHTLCSATTSGTFTTKPISPPPAAASFVFYQSTCTTGTIHWAAVTDALIYRIQISLLGDFSTLLHDITTSGWSHYFTGNPNTTYYYRVATSNGNNCMGNFSGTQSFTMQLPPAPTNITHSNITCNQVLISWMSSYTDSKIQISDNSSFTGTLIADAVITGFSYQANGLKPSSNYFYRIASREGSSCQGNYSSSGSFTTLSGNTTLNMLTSLGFNNVGGYYEVCNPADIQVGGISSCINRWQLEIQYFSDEFYIMRPFQGNASYEWISQVNSGAIPANITPSGLAAYLIQNGGQVYPANNIFEPNGYFKIYLKNGFYDGTTTQWFAPREIRFHICLFSINGNSGSGPIDICQNDPILLQSAANAPGYLIEVVESDASGNPTGTPQTFQVPNPPDLQGGLDILPLLPPGTFQPSLYYRITLQTQPFISVSSKIIRIKPAAVQFSVNGTSAPVTICSGDQLAADFALSSCVTNYYFYMEVTDASFTSTGNRYGRALNMADINNYGGNSSFEINRFASDHGLVLQPGFYNFIIGADYPYTEYSFGIEIQPGNPLFSVNGQSTSTVQVCPTDQIIFNGSTSSCARNYYELNMVLCDANGNALSGWINGQPLDVSQPIDLRAYAASHGLMLQPGNYYKIELGVGTPVVYANLILHIQSPVSQAYAGKDLVACGTSVNLGAANPLVGAGTWSILSGTGGVIGSANNANSIFNGTIGNVYQLKWTVTSACGSTSDTVKIYMNTIQYTDGNDAYWAERCHAYRPVCVDGFGYYWDTTNQQYIRDSAGVSSEVLLLLPYHRKVNSLKNSFISRSKLSGWGGNNNPYGVNGQIWGWDSTSLWDWAKSISPVVQLPSAYFYPNMDSIQWDQENMFVSPLSFNGNHGIPGAYYTNRLPGGSLLPMSYMLDSAAISTSYNLYNSLIYKPRNVWPGAGMYSTANPAVINPGNIDLGNATDYLLQQNALNSNCAVVWGKGWRLPTKTEVGVKEDMNGYTWPWSIDGGYRTGNHDRLMTSSVATTNNLDSVWTVYAGSLQYEQEITNVAINSIGVRCVFNTRLGCPDPSHPDSVGKMIYITEEDAITNLDNRGIKDIETKFIPTGLYDENKPLKLNFSAVPNPASSSVMFLIGSEGVFRMEMYDNSGRQVLNRPVKNSDMIDIQVYRNGVYLIRLLSESGELIGSQRLIKE